MNEHGLKKFSRVGLNPIRWGINPYVAFIVFGTDISMLVEKVDFDLESDLIIGQITKSDNPQERYAFEYRPGRGFESVDVKNQTWFDFK